VPPGGRGNPSGPRPLGTDEDLLRFIDDGQLAHYVVGDARTSPDRPSNATCKLGVVAPHSAFTPHAHGGEHFVLSLGHASCGLFDERRDTSVDLRGAVELTKALLALEERTPDLTTTWRERVAPRRYWRTRHR
jgi:hypothetical protein